MRSFVQQKIVTLTINPALDKHTHIEQVVPNQKLRCEPPSREPGGGGVNVARAIHRLGGEALALYPCGGPIGEMFQRLLDDEGVAHQPLPIDGLTRENIVVFEDRSNQQFILNMPGPELRQAEWQGAIQALAEVDPRPDYIVASGSCPPGVPDDFYRRVAELAHELGSRFIVDTSEAPLRLAAQAGVYLLKPNMREVGQLAGQEIESEEQQVSAAKDLVESEQAEVVVVSMGAGGALLVTQEIQEHLRTPTVPIRSRLGAGDSMVAGIVLGLSRGKSIREATLFGMAAGAATVMLPGTELCRREDTERLYERLTSGAAQRE
jgi:6-phosphofructokinase 2